MIEVKQEINSRTYHIANHYLASINEQITEPIVLKSYSSY